MKRLLLFLALPVLLSACYARGGYVAVATAPPPPRVVVVDPRPGYIWVDGHWVWNGGSWAWNDGYWEAERPGYVWIGGNWVVHGGSHHWRQGYWRPRARGTVVVPSQRPSAPGRWRPSGSTVVHDQRN